MKAPMIEIKHPDGVCECCFVVYGRVDSYCTLNDELLNDYTEGEPHPSNNKDCPGPGKHYLIPADKLTVEAVAKAICDGENREKYRDCSKCQRWRDKLPAARAVLALLGVEEE